MEFDKPIVRFAHAFNAEQVDGIPPLKLTDKAYEWETIELGHWTGDEKRLNREKGPFGSDVYSREELRAEIASWMLGQEIGIGHDPGQHVAYMQSWIKALKEDPYEIVRACLDAEKIKEYVFDLERKKELLQEGPEQLVQPEKAAQRGKSFEKGEQIAAMGIPVNPAQGKTFLAVPYREKERAKKLGAKWDKESKLWYAPEGTDLTPLASWMSEKTPAPEPSLAPQEEFAHALEQFGLDLRGKEPVMDGQIHRVPLIGKKNGDLDGAYCGYLDDRPAGWMQDFSAGEKHTWVATGHTLTKEQLDAQRADIALKQEERQRLVLERQQRTSRDAHTEWIAYDWATNENPYLQAKGVPAFGVREDVDGNLLVPVMTVDKELRGLQTISPEGEKRFMYGMEKNGNFHLIAEPGKDLSQGEIILAEGYATGATLHMATEKPVAVAFDAGNLEPVAKKLREKFPNAAITICADNDHQHTRRTPEGVEPWNKGVELAQTAAQEVGGKVVVPSFTDEEKARGLTDFNDLHQSRGLDEVKRQVGVVLQKGIEQAKGRDRRISQELFL